MRKKFSAGDTKFEARATDLFLSFVNHQLRTPLTTLTGYAQMLEKRGRLREKELGWLEVILTECQRLKAYLEDLSDATEYKLSHLHSQPTSVEMAPLLERFRLLASWRYSQLIWRVRLDKDYSVVVDPEKFLIALWGLLRSLAPFLAGPLTVDLMGEGMVRSLRFRGVAKKTMPAAKIANSFGFLLAGQLLERQSLDLLITDSSAVVVVSIPLTVAKKRRHP